MQNFKKSIFILTSLVYIINNTSVLNGIPFGSSIKSLKNRASDLLHAAFDRNKGFKTPFTRGAGRWSDPSEENNTDYFNRLAEPETQREDWYQKTPYISEFWCSISNIPLICVGLYHGCPEAVFAGIASLAYHSCPKQWLLHLDRLGVALVFSKGIREYKVVQENPKLLAIPAAVIALNGADVYLGQYQGKTWPHVVWHLSAALMAHIFLSSMKSKVA